MGETKDGRYPVLVDINPATRQSRLIFKQPSVLKIQEGTFSIQGGLFHIQFQDGAIILPSQIVKIGELLMIDRYALATSLILASTVISQAADTKGLHLYYSPARGDNFSTGTEAGRRDAIGSGYRYVRKQACIHANQAPGTVPLKLYWNPQRGDNFTTATPRGEQDALSAGYQFVRIEGYVSSTDMPDSAHLVLYWSPARGDNFTVTTGKGSEAAIGAGYDRVRVEGYGFYPETCQ